jgi:DNA-binding winged helix-turn-helix (wHTH) protein
VKQSFNNFELDTRLFELRNQGVRVSIEPQTYNVLAYLLANRDRVVSKQELLDNLWEGRVVSESSLNTCIKAARKAVNDNGQDQNTIATLHRRGYRFIADIEEIADQESGSAEPTQSETVVDSSCLAHIDDRLSLVDSFHAQPR